MRMQAASLAQGRQDEGSQTSQQVFREIINRIRQLKAGEHLASSMVPVRDQPGLRVPSLS
jgi:hypothetical protein